MILYATTTSERASKGQGGNKFIEISVNGEDEQIFHKVYVTLNKEGKPLVATYTPKGVHKADFDTFEAFVTLVDYGTKGKSQKGEEDYIIPKCGHLHSLEPCEYCKH